MLNAQEAVQQAANQQAPAGFTVTDPKYPAEMYKDPDASHYTYWWAQSSDGNYSLVLSTDRNGDGKVYVFLLGGSDKYLHQYTVDKNKSVEITADEGYFGKVYNDGQSGVFVSSGRTWKLKFNVFDSEASKDNGDYGSISFMIPQVETQTTTYVTYFDSKGNKVDNPIEISDPVIQKGLDGQHYTTQGGKVLTGYFAKEPKNAEGFMSPFGKQGATYTKDWHDGLKATFTETDTTTGLMHVVVEYDGKEITNFDLAYGESKPVKYSYYDDSYGLVTSKVTIHSIYIPQTINIQYVYEKLGNLIIDSDSKAFPPLPPEYKTTSQYPNDKNDSTKAGNVKIPEVPGFTPTINGMIKGKVKTYTLTDKDYDPADKSYTFNPADYVSDLSQNITVKYAPDAQKATVTYIDQTTGKTLTVKNLAGHTLEDTGYNTKSAIDAYKNLGYDLVSDDTNGAEIIFDDDDTADQAYKVVLAHGYATVTSDMDKQAGTPINPDKNGAKWPEGSTKSALQHDVKRNITYVVVNGKKSAPAGVNDSLHYEATATVDKVTGQVVKTVWSAPQDFKEIASPALKGYTADKKSISDKNIAHDHADIKEVVTYAPDAQTATVTYVDQTTGKTLTVKNLTGHTLEDTGYNTASDIKHYVDNGYDLVSDDTKGSEIIFDDDDAADQAYTVTLKHGHATVTPDQDPQKGQKTVTQTIKYEYADGTATGLADNVQTLTFKRIGDKDLVTDKVTWPDWSTVAGQQTSVVTSPALKGYTADTNEIPAITYHAGDSDVTYVVKYYADAQHAVINYIDGESDEILHTDKVNGHSDEKINYSTADMIKQLEAKGYELYKDYFPAGEKFDNDDKNDQTYTVIFKHHRENVDPNHSSADGTKGTKTLTETVHYKYADGTKAAEDQTAQVTFTRNGVLDDVTGIVAWGKWNEASQSYKALTSPTIAGYTPSEAVVKRSSNSDAEQGPTLTVLYTADAQKVHVQYIDGETDKLLRQDDLDGYTDETIPYSTAEGIKKFEGDGYELFKDNFLAGEKFDNDDKNDQTYTVIFKHHRENVDPNHSSADGTKGTKTLTETVHYKYADGTKAAEDQTAQVTFTRNGVLDDVTGIVAWGKWNEASQSYKALTSPTIAGYTPSEAVVKRSSNSDAEQGPTLTVLYTADAQTAYVKYIDDTTGKTLRQDDLHGYTDETIPYSTAEGIKKYEGDGYVLVSDGFKPGTKFGVGTPTYEVHFKHGTTHTNATDENAEQKTVTETIHYVYENNQTAQPDYTAAVTFKRGYTTDNVTGKVASYDPWTIDGKQADSKTFAAVTSPAVEGYTPNHKQINEFTVTPGSKDIVKTVVYVGDPQEAQAIFYDETTGKEISNTREIVNGKTDEAISFTKDPNEVVKELEKQGYVFDKDNANNNVFVAGTTYDKNSEVHQYFKYYFTHATTIVTPDNPKTPADVLPDNPGKNYPSGVAKDDLNKTVTRTINITTPDGKTQTITQKAEFTRSATVDEVTGEVTYGPWSKNVVLESVDVPNIPGYVPSASVPEITVTPNDQDMTINITYKKLDSGKATDQGGNASNGGQATNGGSTTGQSAQNGQSGQTQTNAGAQQLPQTGNANNEKGALGLAGALFAAGLGLGFGSKKKRHEN